MKEVEESTRARERVIGSGDVELEEEEKLRLEE